MFTITFLKALAEKAIRTFAQALGALLVADGTDILGTAWGDRLSVSGMAALIAILMAVGTGAVTANSTTSLVTEYDAKHDTP